MPNPSAPDPPPGHEAAARVACRAEGGFVAVLDRLGVSLALSTRPGLVVLLGAAEGELTLSATVLAQPMGLSAAPGRLAVATARTVMVFADAGRLAPHHPGRPGHYDAFFVPRTIHMTGDCQMHDMVFGEGGTLLGVNTAYSCVCRVGQGTDSFVPLWMPPFVTQLRGEDRCHLNGFAMEGNQLRYVTALAATDEPRGWRARGVHEGVLFDAERGTVLRRDLCMPHSPRLVDGTLFVLNGGEGEVLRVDRATGAATVLARLPGFTHGLWAHGGCLFVGLSQNRATRADDPMPVARRHPGLLAGVVALEQATGAVLGQLEFTAGVTEVYDVQVLPGIRRAGLQSLLSDDRYVAVNTPNAVFWTRRAENDAHHAAEVVGTGHYQLSIDTA